MKLASTLFLAASALQIPKEEGTMIPDGWVKKEEAPKDALIQLVVAVKNQNLDQLKSFVQEVSDPDNKQYGNYMSNEQVADLTEPGVTSLMAVRSFLTGSEIDVEGCGTTPNKDFISCTTSIDVAERMLNTKYYRFEHLSGNSALRAISYSLPEEVANHIDFVQPTTKLPVLRQPKQTPGANGQNTPKSLRALYSVGDVRGNSTTNIQACTAFLKQHYKPKDLDKFWDKYYPENKGTTIKVIGPDSGMFAGVEASLDIEYISAMGGGVNTEFWSFAGNAPDNKQNEPFLDWMQLVANTSDATVPKVFSTSYGECENTVSMDYMTRVNAEFMKAAARGLTLTFATGDNGVGADSGSCTRFCGQWPASSHYVTGVGGTEGGSAPTAGGSTGEEAWSGSAGGFSDRFSIADWQSDAVSTYKSTVSKLPQPTRYNNTGRGFPDVSAQAVNFLVINDGIGTPVAGTSCACPTFSGIVGLLNDLRAQAGKPSLGLLNPFLYKNAAAFNDITKGNNPGCGTEGFEASKGWDAITGLGTPNYQKLAAAVNALP